MNGLLIVEPISPYKNIGDYIQSIAQRQFFDKIDCFVDREHLSEFESDEPVNLIMNGWYMWFPEKFPPSECINPLFISFHINPKISEQLLTKKNIDYLKRFEPIGCRDKNTCRILERKGIKTWFSGCLTLTLGLSYLSKEKTNNIYIVDPSFQIKRFTGNRIKRLFSSLKMILKYWKKIKIIKDSFCYNEISSQFYIKRIYNKYLQLASFYEQYSNCFDDDILLNAKYISHVIPSRGKSNDDFLLEADRLLKLYSEAHLVITSRIHAALPCLSLKTPCIFISNETLKRNDGGPATGRLEGLSELFNVIEYNNGTLLSDNNINKISFSTIPQNSNAYEVLRDNLVKSCNEFVNRFSIK